MAFDPTRIRMAIPRYSIDQIVGIATGTVSVSAASIGTPTTTATGTFDTGFNDSCYFQGIYSLDAGTTWNDLGVYVPDLSTPGSPVFQTTTLRGYVTSAGVFTAVALNWYNSVTASSQAYDILYKVALIAKIGQSDIAPINTNEATYYRSNTNYQKIVDQNTFVASTSSSTVVTHNLGYIPNARGFFVNDSSTVGADGIYSVPAGSMCTLDWFIGTVAIDESNVTFSPLLDSSLSGIAGTMHYKIYLDS